MWALFNNSEPQNIKARSTFKASFLGQQVQKLDILHQEAKALQTCSSNTLRDCAILTTGHPLLRSTQDISRDINRDIGLQRFPESFQQLRINTQKLSHQIYKFNESYQVSVQMRDLQKVNDHLFFKTIMRNYDDKRKTLKDYIMKLQNRVQEKEYVTMSHRSYRAININPMDTVPNSEFGSKFKDKFDDRKQIMDNIRSKIRINQELTREIIEKISRSSQIKLQMGQQETNYSYEQTGLFGLLGCLWLKQRTKKEQFIDKLTITKKRCNKLNFENKAIKEASLKHQSVVTFIELQNSIQQSQKRVPRSICIQYLKCLSTIVKRRFEDGISYTRGKYRSKSLPRQKSTKEEQKFNKNSTKDATQQNTDLEGDLTASFMQHCQYLISEKFIVDADQEHV